MQVDSAVINRLLFPVNQSRHSSVEDRAVKGYTKNQAVKNVPIASRTTVRWGNTAGFTGLVYLVMASSSYSQDKQRAQI